MKKRIAFVCVWLTVTLLASVALGAGTTLRVFTPFADMDMAAQSYMDMITAWEGETGNLVEDYSGLTDDVWMNNMLESVRNGKVDVVVLPVGTGLTSQELVTAEELGQALPDLGLHPFASMAEADGSVLLTPMRVNWEALYINTDVLEQNGLSVPTTYEELISVCSALSGKGITPMANALGEWSEIVLDCLALASVPAEQFGTQASLDGAQQMLTALFAAGAFGKDPFNVSDAQMTEAFLSGEAAMRIDGDWLAYEVGTERRENVTVIPMPQPQGQAHSVLAGMPSYGVAITRACWEDEARREAALSFVSTMLSEEMCVHLAVGVEGALGESVATMLRNATDCAGILYDAIDTDFVRWSESVISSLMEQ